MDEPGEWLDVLEADLQRERLRMDRHMEDINRVERLLWALFAAFAFGSMAAVVYEVCVHHVEPVATFLPAEQPN